MSIRFDYDGVSLTEYYTRSGAPVSAYPITFACWFNTDDAAVNQMLMSIYLTTGQNPRWEIFLNADGTLSFYAKQSNAVQNSATTSTSASSSTWHHACGVGASATDRRVYLDNAGEGAQTTSTTPSGMNTTGIARSQFTLGFDGMLAELAIWNVALGADERAALAAGYSPLLVRRNALAMYMPLMSSPSGVIDRMGGLFSLTGTVASDAHPRIIYPERRRSFFIPVAQHIVTLNQVTETDLAQAVARVKVKGIGQAAETDLAQAMARVKVLGISQVTETDVAQPVARLKALALGQATETDLAQPIQTAGEKLIAVGQAAETDLAQPFGSAKVKSLGLATESDAAIAVTALKTIALGLASETDLAQAIARLKARTVGQASERDVALALTVIGGAPQGPGLITTADRLAALVTSVDSGRNSIVSGNSGRSSITTSDGPR